MARESTEKEKESDGAISRERGEGERGEVVVAAAPATAGSTGTVGAGGVGGVVDRIRV